ncbi:MAG: hypothetical protein EP332_13615 [Bacteroidetes bacterium]|nr:MAG: hypothetical protein EP332_13615 [Bacteroidota bacterium]
MKKCFLFLALFLPFLASATIWTVDNTPGSGAQCTTLFAAQDSASNGDTILVMPSYSVYASLTVTKKLFIYSRGHSSNTIDKDKRAQVSGFTFNANADSSVIAGLFISGQVSISSVSGNRARAIRIINNQITAGIYLDGDENLIQGNVLTGFTNFYGTYIYVINAAQNNLILNNYFSFTIGSGNYNGNSFMFIRDGNSSNLVSGNIFAEIKNGSGNVNGGGIGFIRNSYVKVYNNIMWSNVPSRSRFDTLNLGSVFRNNITYSALNTPDTLPGINYNDTMPVFVGGYDATNPPSYNENNDMHLSSSSIGVLGGTDSTDVGLYNGGYKFSIVGNVPGVAVFDDFEILNPVIKKGGVLKVKIKARKPE